jgi:hypothetical protein
LAPSEWLLAFVPLILLAIAIIWISRLPAIEHAGKRYLEHNHEVRLGE